jgi:hypothetical protein
MNILPDQVYVQYSVKMYGTALGHSIKGATHTTIGTATVTELVIEHDDRAIDQAVLNEMEAR